MTLTEINSLVVDDIKKQLQSRCFEKKSPTPQEPIPLPYDYVYQDWYDYQFSETELEDELVLYKAELVLVENERLRVLDIRERISNLNDMRASFHSLHPDKPNPAIFFRDLESENATSAETTLAALETKDTELNNIKNSTAWIEQRKAEYPKIEELIIAMWEGDQATIDQLEADRQAVKTAYPKV